MKDAAIISSQKKLYGFPINPFSRWNGSWKLYTKNCESCGCYAIKEGEERCYEGAAWKRLVHDKNKTSRKCQLVDAS